MSKFSEIERHFILRDKEFHVDRSEMDVVADYPKNALVEITNGCNHSCVFCKNAYQKRKAQIISPEIFVSFLDQAVSLGLKEVGLYATGEPFLVKGINQYIKLAKLKKIERVYVTTNGVLATLDKVKSCVMDGLDSIKFSINAANRKDYELVHGSDDFDRVMKNIRDIYNWKKNESERLQMLASCVIIPALENVESDFKEVFRDYFDDIIFVNSANQGGQSFEVVNLVGAAAENIFSDLNKIPSASEVTPCQMVWNRYHLTAEGYLTACCVDYDLDLVFSDLNTETVEASWNNATIKKIRSAHLSQKLGNLLCNQCIYNRPAPYEPVTKISAENKTKAQKMSELNNLSERIKKLSRDF